MLGKYNCCVCCEEPAALGCVSGCELILPEAAAVSGTYTLRGEFKGVLFEIKTNALVGEVLTFDISTLNEDYSYTAELLNPSGELIPVDGAKCFTFSKVPKF